MTKSWTARRLIRAVVVGLALLLLGLLPVSIPTGDDTTVPGGPALQPVGGIFDGITVTQRFPAAGAEISAIALQLATYRRVNAGALDLTVYAETAGEWRPIAGRTTSKELVKDNAYHTFTFSPPLVVRKDQPLALEVRADGDAGQAVSWWMNPAWAPEGFQLLVNGQPQPGTGRFTVQYARRSGPLIMLLPRFWDRLTVFLDPLWQIVLALGFGLALVGVGAYLLRAR